MRVIASASAARSTTCARLGRPPDGACLWQPSTVTRLSDLPTPQLPRAQLPKNRTPGPDVFDRWSATYDSRRLQALTYRPIHNAMLDRLQGLEPSAILDLGCGTGQFLPRLRASFPSAALIGVDLSHGMLTQASERYPTAHGSDRSGALGGLVRADAMALPMRRGSMDVVTCSESFHWYPDQAGALEEIAKVLAPDGRLIIASIAATTNLGSAGVRLWSEAFGQPIRALTPRSLAKLLTRCGFDVIQQRRLPRWGLVPWPVMTDARLSAP